MSGSGGGCSRFKQNAWKKEMCSNCYKTKDEHQDRPRPALPDLPLIPASQGILKGWDRDRKKKRKSVSFPMDECEVIGFGGDDMSSDEEMEFEEMPSSREESSEEPDGEDDRALKKITKNNTDFNSVLVNLSGGKPVPAVHLGSPKRDTIQVTVQPFSNSLANSRKLHLNKLLQDNTPSLTIIPCEKKEEPPKEVETRKVNITRGSIITKNHESVKNKLYIQNILNNKNEKRNSFSLLQDKVYITTSTKVNEEKDENVDYMNGKNMNCVVLNCNGVSLLGLDSEKDKVLMESREMAGEPDGKADSDEAEIPVTPPPRISFLHRDTPPEVKRVSETFESKRISTVETVDVKRTTENTQERRPVDSPELDRFSDTVEIRRVSESESSRRVSDPESSRRVSETKEVSESESLELRRSEANERRVVEVSERRISDTQENPRRICEPTIRRLSDTTENRRIGDSTDERRFSEVPEVWRVNDVVETRRHSVTPEEMIRCTKRQAPKPPQAEYESELESEIKTESETSSVECCERAVFLRIEKPETPVQIRTVRPDSLKISVSSEESASPSSSPEPDKPEVFYDTRRNSPKREPPPLPPTTPEPRKSPPEPAPRHKSFMDVEKKKTKMKETIKKLLRFGTKEEMEVEIQSPRVRPQIIHPLDLNKSAVQVLPSSNMMKSSSPDIPSTPSTPTPPAIPIGRPNKPPPPPRSESLNLMERLRTKPGSENNIYANLGEARSGMTPVKPVRTGSMREVGGKLTAVVVRDPTSKDDDSAEDVADCCMTTVEGGGAAGSSGVGPCHQDQDNLYEAIGSASSAPECDMGQHTYYGSETESDTYSAAHHESVGRDGRRGRMVVPYPTIEENFSALSQLNLQAINHLLTKILERDKTGGNLNDYRVDVVGRREICKSAFIQAERMSKSSSPGRRVTLAVTPPESSLIMPHSLPVLARFTDTLPHDFLPTQPYTAIGEVTVLNCGEVSRLTDDDTASVAAEVEMEHKLLVLLQVLQIITQINSRQCHLDNFVLVRDTQNQLSVTYLHQASDEGESWKVALDRLCDRYKIVDPLRHRLASCLTDEEATSAVRAWLYGPPPCLGRDALQPWLNLQRAYALRSYLARPDSASAQHIVFLASNLDLNSLYNDSCLLQQPSQ